MFSLCYSLTSNCHTQSQSRDMATGLVIWTSSRCLDVQMTQCGSRFWGRPILRVTKHWALNPCLLTFSWVRSLCIFYSWVISGVLHTCVCVCKDRFFFCMWRSNCYSSWNDTSIANTNSGENVQGFSFIATISVLQERTQGAKWVSATPLWIKHSPL